jgi:hypothetical protein
VKSGGVPWATKSEKEITINAPVPEKLILQSRQQPRVPYNAILYNGLKDVFVSYLPKNIFSIPILGMVVISEILFICGCIFETEKFAPPLESNLSGNWRSITIDPDSSIRNMAISNGQMTTYLERRNCFIKWRQEHFAFSGDTLKGAFSYAIYHGNTAQIADTLTLISNENGKVIETAYIRSSAIIQSETSVDLTLKHELSVLKYPLDSSREINYGDSIQFIVDYTLDSTNFSSFNYSLSVYIDENSPSTAPFRKVDLTNRRGIIVFGLNTALLPGSSTMIWNGIHIRISLEAYDCNLNPVATGVNFENKYYFRNILGTSGKAFADVKDYTIYQRDVAKKSASIKIAGDADSSIRSIKVRAILDSNGKVVADWKYLNISNSKFSDSISLPQGGWYRFQYALTKTFGSEEMLFSHKFGVGMNILCIGQSNMSGRGEGAYKQVSDIMALYRNDSGWGHLTDPFDGGGLPGQIDNDDRNPRYSMIPELVTELSSLGFPIGIIPACKGSTAMYDPLMALPWSAMTWSFRNTQNPKAINTLYGNSLSKIDSVGGIELIIMDQGEKDVGIGYENYKTAFERMLSNYRQDVSDSLPIFFAQIGNKSIGPDSINYTEIQSAQADVADGKKNILAAKTSDLNTLMSEHYTAESLDSLGSRFAKSILDYLSE